MPAAASATDDFDARCPIAATDMPEARLRLVRDWAVGGDFYELARAAGGQSGLGSLNGFDGKSLVDSELFWVSEDVCATVQAAQDSYPDDTILDETFLPAPNGLCLFSLPFKAHDADYPDRPLRVDAINWGPCLIGRRDQSRREEGIAISSYAWDPSLDRLVALGRSDWLFGRPLGAQTFDAEPMPASNLASVIEDRRVIATLCSLVANPRLTKTEDQIPARPIRRRSERAGVAPERVRVHSLLLNREHRDASEEPSDGRYHHRFIVRGHWRQARVGPRLRELDDGTRVEIPAEQRQTRPVWIDAHVKGPDGAPLLDPGNKVHRL